MAISNPFDYSVKSRGVEGSPICPEPPHELLARQKVGQDDYSCSESKPCSNGACCSKTSGYCGYGPDSCGTSGQSPNDKCWSHCDAKAECGRYAKEPGQKCPLNVCCSQFGFCGSSAEFCAETDNVNTTCQSNCDQPGSGASGGDVQKRIIGYYETWVANRICNGMAINQIPVNALTHLHFSFAYITPGSFLVIPMDGVDESVLQDFAGIKSKNSGLKTIVSIGGWTFSDNGTTTQPLFGEICASSSNRKTFITNLLDFMRQYAFDGVDFDWEYPGASDRGGQPDDGKNFVTLLKELREAFDAEPIPYSIAFTAPTSYWYLRNFDLSAVDHVDWINVMSYDLHGVWDAQNPIGNNVLVHTNLTEVKLALDLFWRNKVPANKLNLGLGFYGRSFQLSDPSCSKPGCQFKGGAAPGPCTANSGTLAYFEIMDIIEAQNLKPYYDKDAQAKYIVWNNDQWVSYDDEDTFKAKIDFANNLGLGGLLIWSIDQDTQNLDALKAVLGNKGIDAFKNKAADAAYWQEAGAQDCYVSDCGGSCDTGFIPITHQPCGSAKPVTRHSSKKDSKLCCPLAAAPNPKDCTWRGSAPSCNGHCADDEVAVELNRWGDGKYCENGNKAYCCKSKAVENTCYWSSIGGSCKKGDQPLTFAGTFLETVADIMSLGGLFGQVLSDFLDGIDMDLRKLYCCPSDMMKQWQNCNWHGEPGSCFDNHCDTGHQVQLTSSDYGAGQSCAPRLERTRVFCCDPAKGKSPFLPVPLDYLFPNPPTGDNVDSDFDLKIDDTWGTGHDETNDEDDPDNAKFGFWVMTSPEEIQISLDRRDGSHWELFNCQDATSEEAQTVQMVCTDFSEDSNCYRIGLGHGVPGTIIEMPKGKGCGPAKYAVAVSMEVSKNQTIPHYLHKRMAGALPVVYDLTFDYDWMRVPRDLGDTQVRIDYSNENGYWDNAVNKAGEEKRKRSLEEMGGNHKRWLEEEWRDDVHFGALTTEELHKRWFGSDITSWLRGLLNVNIKPTFTHDYEDSVTAIILNDHWSCQPNPQTTISAGISAKATANIKVSSSFGMTIMTRLGPSLDLSNSYLFLKTKGEISAISTIDALLKTSFDSKDFALATVPFRRASFSIPNLLTVGLKFVLNARATADVQLSGHFETKVDIASWDMQQTYPDENSEFDPKSLSDPQFDGQLKMSTIDLSDSSEPSSRSGTNLQVDRGDALLDNPELNETVTRALRLLEKRGNSKPYVICPEDAKMSYRAPEYPPGTTLYDCDDWTNCNDFGFGVQNREITGHGYHAEHILERQMIQQFALRYIEHRPSPTGPFASYCKFFSYHWNGQRGYIDGVRAWDVVASAYPSSAAHGDEIVRTEKRINPAKARAFNSKENINSEKTMRGWLQTEGGASDVVKAVKVAILAVKYMAEPTIQANFNAQGRRVAAQFAAVEAALQRNWANTPTPYAVQNLHDKWLEFMHEYTNQVIMKFKEYLDLWGGGLVSWLPQQNEQLSPSRQILATKITSLRNEIDTVINGGLFPNTF
ncbi:glycosyl hydrolases family 18-domain-containing protein [Hypoxylon sp. FL1857]|nr:glycosyl hydrolases family 18-domain-containing protein [Hypoxylon sp. FL1857]